MELKTFHFSFVLKRRCFLVAACFAMLFLLLEPAFADTPPRSSIATEHLLTLNTKDRKSLKAVIKHYGTLSYGPLFSYGEESNLIVSFGIVMSASRSWPSLNGKKIHLKAGLNRIKGPWNDQVAGLFKDIHAMDRFHNEIAVQSRPETGKPGSYRVGFGSCLRADLDEKQRIFNRIRKLNPHAFMLIGDTVYNDLPSGVFDQPYRLEKKYNRQLQIRRFQDFYSQIPLYTVWDDHDFWENDADRDQVSSENRRLSRSLFTSIFPNPAEGEAGKGIYFKWSLGDIDFFMLDTRWFRRKSKSQMLGNSQNSWLRQQLLASDATFKVLVSSVQWHEKGGKDSWSDYLPERDVLFQFLFENKINGILLLSGDAHFGAAYQLSPNLSTAGYPLTEFTSSGMAVPPKKKSLVKTEEVTQLLNVPNKHNFGMLEFQTTGDNPYVDLKLYAPEKTASWQEGQTSYRVYANDLQRMPAPQKTAIQTDSAAPSPPEEMPETLSSQAIETEKAATPPSNTAEKQKKTLTSKPTPPPVRQAAKIKRSQTHLTATPQECPEAPIFSLKKLRQKGLSEEEIRQVCHGE